MGAGDDRFQWDPGDGSDTVDGQGGNDRLDFNGSNASEEITFSANAGRAVLFRNVASITMDLDGLEHVDLRSLGGTDTHHGRRSRRDRPQGSSTSTSTRSQAAVTARPTRSSPAAATRRTRSRSRARTDARSSTASAPRPASPAARRRWTTSSPQTLGGADIATMTVGVTSPIPLHIDGGDGDDTARYNGTAGADEIAHRSATEPRSRSRTPAQRHLRRPRPSRA